MSRMNPLGMISPAGDSAGPVHNPNIVPTIAGIPITGVIGTAQGGHEAASVSDDFVDFLVRTPYFTATGSVTMVVDLDWPSADWGDSHGPQRYAAQIVLYNVDKGKETIHRTSFFRPIPVDAMYSDPESNNGGHISAIVDITKAGTYFIAGRFTLRQGSLACG